MESVSNYPVTFGEISGLGEGSLRVLFVCEIKNIPTRINVTISSGFVMRFCMILVIITYLIK